MAKAAPRESTQLIKSLINFLLGRNHTTALRYADYYSPRTQPSPVMPPGPHDKLSANYYYSRDGRREMAPPVLIAENTREQKYLPPAASQETSTSLVGQQKKLPAPGGVFRWD